MQNRKIKFHVNSLHHIVIRYLHGYWYCNFVYYFLQTLLVHSTIATIIVFIAITAMAVPIALLLPIETKGRAMKVTVMHNTKCAYQPDHLHVLLYLTQLMYVTTC